MTIARIAAAAAVAAAFLAGARALASTDGTADAAAAPATATARPAVPAEIDLRPRFAEWGLALRGQDSRPTCSVFAVVWAIEFALARARGHGEPLSVEYANWAANQASGRVDDGSFFHEVWSGYQAHGICPEPLMPYAARFDPNAVPPDAAREAARELHARFPLRIHWIAPLPERPGLSEAHLAAIKAVLAAGYPVCGGSHHSVLFVGYRDDPREPGGGVLYVRDSAGAGGHGSISYEAAKARFGDVLWIEAAR